MKLKGVVAGFLSCKAGQHRQFNHWYDTDHVPENRAVPGIFHAQRYVAPTDYLAVRGPVAEDVLAYNGGQYLTLYYTEADVTATLGAMKELGQRLWGQQRMFLGAKSVLTQPFALERVWPGRVTTLAPGAIPLAPHQGLFVALGEVVDPAREHDWLQWEQDIHMPDILESKGYAAGFMFRSRDPGHENRFLFLFYLDDDPLAAVADMRSRVPQWHQRGRMIDVDKHFRFFLRSIYRPITPLRYDFVEE